jgi:hypothetical protein
MLILQRGRKLKDLAKYYNVYGTVAPCATPSVSPALMDSIKV